MARLGFTNADLPILYEGPRQVKNMDVYLEPLIEELETLWRGVQMDDMSRPPDARSFMMHGLVTWTIHDYPGMALCSGMHII